MKNNAVFVLLAGGKSERMGIDKGLLKFNENFWILEQLNRISKSPIKYVYIGLGYNFEQYLNAIPWLEMAQFNSAEFQGLNVKIVINKNPELGSFSTLQTVLKAIPKSLGILVNHIDIPILNSEELTKIISSSNEIALPNFEGKNGHPIKIASSIWNEFLNLNPKESDTRLDFQLKKINPAKISTIEVSDRAILYNLNKKSDWDSYLMDFK